MWDQGFSAPKSGIQPVETPCGISVFEFNMIHQIPHGETGVFTWKNYVGLGFSCPKKWDSVPGNPMWDQRFRVSRDPLVPTSRNRGFHMENLCGIRVFALPKVGFCPWKPYVGLAFSSFTRSISFHIEKQGFSHGKPMWDQGFRTMETGIAPMKTLCGNSVFEVHMIHQFPHGGNRAFPMENLCGISVFAP